MIIYFVMSSYSLFFPILVELLALVVTSIQTFSDLRSNTNAILK